MTGGLLDRLIARAEAERSALEAEVDAPDRALRLAEVRERLHRLGELRAEALRRPHPHPVSAETEALRLSRLRAGSGRRVS